jgi:hypothetical protein
MIRHFNKGTGQSALNRGAGSLGGLVGAARMVVALSVDSQDDDDRARVFGVVKSNLEAKPASYKLVIESAPVEGFQMTVSKATWIGRSSTSVTDLMERTGEQQQQALDASDSLRDLLAKGPVPSREIMEVMKSQGHTKNAIYAAKSALRVHIERQGFQGQTEWSLPVIRFVETTDAVIPADETTATTATTAKTPPAISKNERDIWGTGITVEPSHPVIPVIRGSSTRALACEDFRAHANDHTRGPNGFYCAVCHPELAA